MVKDRSCKICGAACPQDPVTDVQTCVFCGFEHHGQVDSSVQQPQVKGLDSAEYKKILRQLAKLTPSRIYHAEGFPPHQFSPLNSLSDAELIAFENSDAPVDVLISQNLLPFVPDVNAYFSERFSKISKGGLLYLSTPVRRPYHKPQPLKGQVNFFKSKNIMLLLEQHGFKMAWRQNRFATTLRIIARKN